MYAGGQRVSSVDPVAGPWAEARYRVGRGAAHDLLDCGRPGARKRADQWDLDHEVRATGSHADGPSTQHVALAESRV